MHNRYFLGRPLCWRCRNWQGRARRRAMDIEHGTDVRRIGPFKAALQAVPRFCR